MEGKEGQGGGHKTTGGKGYIHSPGKESHAVKHEPAGHALGKIMHKTKARLSVVSTPERGPSPNMPGYPVHVMTTLERISDLLRPHMINAYDFKGSSSTKSCGAKLPDINLSSEDWESHDSIKATQWCTYWSGRVRAATTAMVMVAESREQDISFEGFGKRAGRSWKYAADAKVALAVSITGGVITQVEYSLLPDLIASTQSDLSTREIKIGQIWILWVHFDTLDDFLKALQGYGGFDPGDVHNQNTFGMPGRWTDGPYNAEFDLLKRVPGHTPEARRAYLQADRPPSKEELGQRLHNAISALAPKRVEEIIELRADPNALTPTGFSALHMAASKCRPDIIGTLLSSRADPAIKTKNGHTPAEYLQSCSKSFPTDHPGVQKQLDETFAALECPS